MVSDLTARQEHQKEIDYKEACAHYMSFIENELYDFIQHKITQFRARHGLAWDDPHLFTIHIQARAEFDEIYGIPQWPLRQRTVRCAFTLLPSVPIMKNCTPTSFMMYLHYSHSLCSILNLSIFERIAVSPTDSII